MVIWYSFQAGSRLILYFFPDRDIKNEKYSPKPVPSTGYQVPPQLSLAQLRYHYVVAGCPINHLVTKAGEK